MPSQAIKDLVARSRAQQGLPPTIEDPYVLDQVGRLLFGDEFGPAILSHVYPPLPDRVVKLERPPRRMPTTNRIAEHWEMPDRICWRCHQIGPVEKAHIVDRMEWEQGAGLDGPQNLALLCESCHKHMPVVKPEDYEVGLRYVGLDSCTSGSRSCARSVHAEASTTR